MKKLRYLLLSLFLTATTLSAQSQDKIGNTGKTAEEIAVIKTDALAKALNMTDHQKTQVHDIILKYDDPNTFAGTTPYFITESAERECMEVLTPGQVDQYEQQSAAIWRTVITPATPPVETPAKKSGKTKSKDAK